MQTTKRPAVFCRSTLIWAAGLTLLHAPVLHAQTGAAFADLLNNSTPEELAPVLAAIEATPSLPGSAAPEAATFFSSQFAGIWPPMPSDVLGLPVWALGDGVYLMDDRNVDYSAFNTDSAGSLSAIPLFGASMSTMNMEALSSQSWSVPVYLTNMAAMPSADLTMAVSFSIAGGTNFVPYDILRSHDLTNSISLGQWSWLGIGYTSNSYTFAEQPVDQSFYVLAAPQKTMTVAWGDNLYHESDVPFHLTNTVAVACSVSQGMALHLDGTVTAWGIDSRLGSVPTNVFGVSAISAGYDCDVVLFTNGTVFAWGWNLYQELNVPAGLTNVVSIASGGEHSLALRSDGSVVAWGYDGFGETNVPPDLLPVTAIACGDYTSLVVQTNGTVRVWGDNRHRQCDVPADLTNAVSLAASLYHSLALRADGTVVAWGDNGFGEANVPVGLSNVVAIAAGAYYTTDYAKTNSAYSLALKSDGTIVQWGTGPAAQPLGGMTGAIAIAAGANYALAVRSGPATPVITLEPVDQYQIPGGSVTFATKGAGLAGVAYQWQYQNVNIGGATNTTLTVTNVGTGVAGAYTVLVSNEVSTVLSTSANLNIVTAPALVSASFSNVTAYYQSYPTLTVTASAVGQYNGFPLSYQWQFGGTNIPGATSNAYSFIAIPSAASTYTVTVTNILGTTNASYAVSLNYGTLAYYLSTNTVARTNGYTPANLVELSGWLWGTNYGTNLYLITNSVWSTSFWLKGVRGLSATSIGISNGVGSRYMVCMVSPRHYLRAQHTGTPEGMIAFLDTNNVIYWRSYIQQVDIPNSDISVGILNFDLPASVGFLPVVPTNLMSYVPTNYAAIVQGIGMNQYMNVFGQPMNFYQYYPLSMYWNPGTSAPFGLTTNWNIVLIPGDSSAPESFLVGNQLVLLSHNFHPSDGPNYAPFFDNINQQMHYLSTNNGVSSNYQLTPFVFTNWPTINN